jgi:hypothetical protein
MGISLSCLETVERARIARRTRRLFLPFLTSALVGTTGCAIHYRSAKSGNEHLWGLGSMAWKADLKETNHPVISSGVRIPGLAIGVGTAFWGVSLGYTVREHLAVTTSNQATNLHAPEILGLTFHENDTSIFGFGHLRLTGPPGRHQALVTGKAIAGLQIALDEARPALHAGTSRTQLTELSATNLFLAIDQDSAAWPYFDFTTSRVEIDDGPTRDETPSPSPP